MGRVDRLHSSEVGTDYYNIYLNLNTFLSLWLQVQSEKNESVKDWLHCHLMFILKYPILPDDCYHLVIERHFENQTTGTLKDPCATQCSFCNGTYKNYCPRISKSQLIAVLTTQVLHKGFFSATSLVPMISSSENKRVKEAIWRGNANKVTPGQVHALILMLIAAKILKLQLPQQHHDTKQFLALKSVEIGLAKQFAFDDDEFETLSCYIDANWLGIPCDP
jgi:hypothetical protein